MKRKFLRRVNVFFVLAVLLFAAGAVVWTLERSAGDAAAIRGRVQEEIQADFLGEITRVQEKCQAWKGMAAASVKFPAADDAIYLWFDDRCRLQRWSDPERMPPQAGLEDLCTLPAHSTYFVQNKTYYFVRESAPGRHIVALIPLFFSYRVDNDNLPSYVYMGRHSGLAQALLESEEVSLHLREVEEGMTIRGDDGQFAFSLRVSHPEVFMHSARKWVIALLLGAWAAAVAGFWLRGRRKRSPYPLLLAAVLTLLLRGMLLVTGGLTLYVPTAWFSPRVLAISSITPSPGDLILNAATALLLFAALRGLLRERVFAWQEKMVRRSGAGILASLAAFAISGLLLAWYISLVARIVPNSTINFEYSRLFTLDYWSFAGLGMVALLFGLIFVLALSVLTWAWSFAQGISWGYWKMAVPAALITVGTGYLVHPDTPGILLVLLSLMVMFYLILLRSQGMRKFRLDLPNFLLIMLIFALPMTTGIAMGLEAQRREKLKQLAEQYSDDHDLVTESQFERAVKEAEEQSFIMQYSPNNNIAERLMENNFASKFKGYDVRLYVYDSAWKRISQNAPFEPYLEPTTATSLQEIGTPTLTENLYLVPYFHGIFESIYIGQFPLLVKDKGRIVVQVELFPTEVMTNRLYPQLVLDEKVRKTIEVPEGYEYAVYKAEKLFRKVSTQSVPLVYQGPQLDTTGDAVREEGGYIVWYHAAPGDKVVMVRTPDIGYAGAANLFSFVFYIVVLASLILLLPAFIVRLLNSPREALALNLRGRIQFFFLLFSLLPLVLVVFVFTPYIKDKIFQQYEENLRLETTRVAGLIREEYAMNRRSGMDAQATSRLLQDKIAGIEKTLFTDVNIFYHTGQLHITTQPSIYELGLTSAYMSPQALDLLRSGKVSDVVVEDRIGRVSYYSGYYPLMNDDRKIIGFLNIPFLKNQDQANEQVQSLLTFLVNIYVFLFLGIGILAVLISNSIISPLNLLAQRLAATRLGRTNEPVEWHSRDELGEIIRAYNRMLEKLAESEKKLAQNEREMAWKEMARQVAHEIKNPLTPMRLSVQHLIRSWKDKSPNTEKLFDKVTQTILVQIEQLVNIANSFSEFARMPEPNRSMFVLQEVLQEVYGLYEHSEGVQLEIHLPEAPFYVLSDRDQLSRVFNNLVKNAIQAIEHDAGRIVIRMEVRQGVAKVSVEDNGKGIPEEIREKIFQPNFSTKNSGMGLGLAIVKKIIESAGGQIYFETTLDTGTTFYVEHPGTEQRPA